MGENDFYRNVSASFIELSLFVLWSLGGRIFLKSLLSVNCEFLDLKFALHFVLHLMLYPFVFFFPEVYG